MIDDDRDFSRHQVRKAGRILFFDQPCFVDCTIMNISENGALLSMRLALPLPHDVLLWEEKTGTLYECDVRWRKDHMVGVHFTDICGRARRRALLQACFVPLTHGRGFPTALHYATVA